LSRGGVPVCRCCHCELTVKNWYPSRRRHKDRICKQCEGIARKAHRARNQEKKRAVDKEWRNANPDKMRAQRYRCNAMRRQWRATAIRDAIDPQAIFERDKWRCKGCGCKTPRDLLGTNGPNAPSIDHIIPLSLGGPHVERNLQCLCRRCNQSKSAKYEGQLAFV